MRHVQIAEQYRVIVVDHEIHRGRDTKCFDGAHAAIRDQNVVDVRRPMYFVTFVSFEVSFIGATLTGRDDAEFARILAKLAKIPATTRNEDGTVTID